MKENGHSDWISSLCFTPGSTVSPQIISGGWDKKVKVWDLKTFSLKQTLVAPSNQVNVVAVSPDGSITASGDKDGVTHLWDNSESMSHLYSMSAKAPINDLAFSPFCYWLCAATDHSVVIFDLEKKAPLTVLRPVVDGKLPVCTSVVWSADGGSLFAGFSDGIIRVWSVSQDL